MKEREINEREINELIEELCEAIKTRTAPWQQPWTNNSIPRNAVTGHVFTGGNAIILAMKGNRLGYKDPRWMTFKQAQSKGWYVKKGSKGTKAILCIPSVSGSRVELNFSTYTLFHASQVQGIPPYVPVIYSEFEKNTQADQILRNSGAIIQWGGDSAFYDPEYDIIHLPFIHKFRDYAYYYATALHELSHWTGHKSRLNRCFSEFGSEAYAFEELIAEMSSMFLSGEIGIPQTKEHFDNHAAYISSWLTILSRDKLAAFELATKYAKESLQYILRKNH